MATLFPVQVFRYTVLYLETLGFHHSCSILFFLSVKGISGVNSFSRFLEICPMGLGLASSFFLQVTNVFFGYIYIYIKSVLGVHSFYRLALWFLDIYIMSKSLGGSFFLQVSIVVFGYIYQKFLGVHAFCRLAL